MELHIKPIMTIMILLGLLLATSETFAQLTLESVYPSLGEIGQGAEGAYSLPKQTILTQESGPDMFEEDDTHLIASVINISDPEAQRHDFHDRGDQDWVKFYAVAGGSYEIKVRNLQSRCDAVVVLYDRDGTTRLTSPDPPYFEGDSGLYGENEFISWDCPADGIYYVMVKEYFADTDFGSDTGYDLGVDYPYASMPTPGFIKGRISDALNAGISGAVLRSNIVYGTAITTPGGYYLMWLPAGTYTVTAEAQSFLPQSRSGIVVNEASTITLDFSLPPLAEGRKGDINNDNNVDLTDLIIVLRALTGLETTGLIRDHYGASGADVNGDGKIGLQDLLSILQKVAEVR